MPELPEVEYAASQLRRATVGKRLSALLIRHPALRRRMAARAAKALAGATVAAVERRGKHQLVRFDDGRTLHVHFRMAGRWIVGRESEPLPRYARAVLVFTDGTRVVLDDSRALSTIEPYAPGMEPPLDLGPDPRDAAFDETWLAHALARRRAPIKNALLDQRVVAGLGNVYAAESLWEARISPHRPACSLDRAELRRLRAAILAVLARADGAQYAASDSDVGRFRVYGREDAPCPRCGGRIARTVQAGRSTYHCPRCQPRRDRRCA